MRKKLLLSILLMLSTNLYAFNLTGTWKLVSIEKNVNNKWQQDCNSPTGLLIYTENGYMAANINCMITKTSHQPSFLEHDMTFYSGRYTIKGNTVTHYITNSDSPIYFGKILSRKIQIIDENNMNLIVKNKNGQIVRLSWEKIVS